MTFGWFRRWLSFAMVGGCVFDAFICFCFHRVNVRVPRFGGVAFAVGQFCDLWVGV